MIEEEKLEPRLLAVLAEHVAVAEDLGDALDHREHLLRTHERVEAGGEVRLGREPAAHPQRVAHVAGVAVADRGEPHIVDLGIAAPEPAAGDRDLVLARQVVELRAAVSGRRVHERRGVHDLVGVETGQGAPGDVARHVAAGAEAAEPAVSKGGKNRWQVLDPHPVELHVLADGEVRHAPRVTLGQVREHAELRGRQDPVGDAERSMKYGTAFPSPPLPPTAPTPSPWV